MHIYTKRSGHTTINQSTDINMRIFI